MRKNINLDIDLRNIFKEEIYDKLKNKLIDLFLINMKEEREGKLINSHTMKMFVEFLNKIEYNQSYDNLYSNDIEEDILIKTDEFYRPIVESSFKSKEYLVYMRWGMEVVVSEEKHLANYLPKNTIFNVLAILKNMIFFSLHREIMDKNNSFKFLVHSANISVIIF
jgi:hypothetical protein